jgi:hypothetical protein
MFFAKKNLNGVAENLFLGEFIKIKNLSTPIAFWPHWDQ